MKTKEYVIIGVVAVVAVVVGNKLSGMIWK
jgi:hypothetical protein